MPVRNIKCKLGKVRYVSTWNIIENIGMTGTPRIHRPTHMCGVFPSLNVNDVLGVPYHEGGPDPQVSLSGSASFYN